VLIDGSSDWCYLALLFTIVVCGLGRIVFNNVPPSQPELILIITLSDLPGSPLAFSCAKGTTVW
jgi:hypothetical protein